MLTQTTHEFPYPKPYPTMPTPWMPLHITRFDQQPLDNNSEDEAVYLRLNVRGEGLEPTVPDGSLYLNAKLSRDADGNIVLEDGLVTFKRPQKVSLATRGHGCPCTRDSTVLLTN